jgi:hypothetical protein
MKLLLTSIAMRSTPIGLSLNLLNWAFYEMLLRELLRLIVLFWLTECARHTFYGSTLTEHLRRI